LGKKEKKHSIGPLFGRQKKRRSLQGRSAFAVQARWGKVGEGAGKKKGFARRWEPRPGVLGSQKRVEYAPGFCGRKKPNSKRMQK